MQLHGWRRLVAVATAVAVATVFFGRSGRLVRVGSAGSAATLLFGQIKSAVAVQPVVFAGFDTLAYRDSPVRARFDRRISRSQYPSSKIVQERQAATESLIEEMERD